MSPVGFIHVHSTVPLLEKKIQQWGMNLCLLEEKKEKRILWGLNARLVLDMY